jgi:hypothetical protein
MIRRWRNFNKHFSLLTQFVINIYTDHSSLDFNVCWDSAACFPFGRKYNISTLQHYANSHSTKFQRGRLKLPYPWIIKITFTTHLNKHGQFLCIMTVNVNCFPFMLPFKAPIPIKMLLITNSHWNVNGIYANLVSITVLIIFVLIIKIFFIGTL